MEMYRYSHGSRAATNWVAALALIAVLFSNVMGRDACEQTSDRGELESNSLVQLGGLKVPIKFTPSDIGPEVQQTVLSQATQKPELHLIRTGISHEVSGKHQTARSTKAIHGFPKERERVVITLQTWLLVAFSIVAVLIAATIAIGPPAPRRRRTEQPSTEQPSTEQPKAEQPEGEQPQAVQPQAVQSRGEQPREEAPSTEQPHAEQPRPESQPEPAPEISAGSEVEGAQSPEVTQSRLNSVSSPFPSIERSRRESYPGSASQPNLVGRTPEQYPNYARAVAVSRSISPQAAAVMSAPACVAAPEESHSPVRAPSSSPRLLSSASSIVDVERLQAEVHHLRQEVAQIRHESSAVEASLVSRKFINRASVDAERHRKHFETMRTTYPFTPEGSLVLAIGEEAIALQVVRFAGVSSAGKLFQASSYFRERLPEYLCVADEDEPGLLFACGGQCSSKELGSAECLDTEARTWKLLPAMAQSRVGAAAAVVGKNLYMCGGYQGKERLRSLERFNASLDAWEVMPEMAEARSNSMCAFIDRRLYVVGGTNGTQALRSAECFDHVAGRWEQLPSMTAPRSGASAVVISRQLIVCGGSNGKERLRSVEMFCPRASKWMVLPAMEGARVGAAAVALDGALYMCGGNAGHTRLNSAERLVFAGLQGQEALETSWKWQVLPKMAEMRGAPVGAALGGCVYVGGGYNGRYRLGSVERFVPAAFAWESVRRMNERRSDAAAVAMAGKIYVFGGYNGQKDLGSAECFDAATGAWEVLPPMSERRARAAVAVVKQN